MLFRRFRAPSPERRARALEDSESRLLWIFEKDAAVDPVYAAMGKALCKKLNWIEDYVQRCLGEPGRGEEYAERAYRNLRGRIHLLRNLEASLVAEVKYEVLGDLQELRSHLSLDEIDEPADPSSVDFVAELMKRDLIESFRACMDEEFRHLFDYVFSTAADK